MVRSHTHTLTPEEEEEEEGASLSSPLRRPWLPSGVLLGAVPPSLPPSLPHSKSLPLPAQWGSPLPPLPSPASAPFPPLVESRAKGGGRKGLYSCKSPSCCNGWLAVVAATDTGGMEKRGAPPRREGEGSGALPPSSVGGAHFGPSGERERERGAVKAVGLGGLGAAKDGRAAAAAEEEEEAFCSGLCGWVGEWAAAIKRRGGEGEGIMGTIRVENARRKKPAGWKIGFFILSSLRSGKMSKGLP